MKRLLVLLCLLVPTGVQAGVARFIDPDNGNNANTGLSWAQAWRTCGKLDSAFQLGTAVAGDTVVFRDTCYDCSISLPSRSGNPQVWTVFCDSTFYANKANPNPGAHYSRYAAGANPPVLYGGHRVTDDAANPSNAWIPHSGNVYKARWREKCYSWQSSQGSIVAPVIQNHDSMLVVLPSSAADVNAKGESYYDDTKDTIYVWMLGAGTGGGDPDGTPFILSRAAVFQQQDDESTTFGWGAVPGTCCKTQQVSGASRIKVTGLDLRGGQPSVIWQNGADQRMDSSIFQHCHISRGMSVWGENGACFLSMGVGSLTSKNNQVVACSLGWGGTRPQSGSASWPSGMFTHGGAITLYTQEYFKTDSCYFYGWAEFGLDYKMDGGSASSYRQNRCTFSIFNPNPGSPSWSRHALRMAVKQLRDSVYGCIFVDGDHSIFFQADGQQSGGAVPNDSSFVGNNTFYNTGDFAYVGEFLAARCGVGHQIKYNVIHDFRPGAGFNGYLGVFAATNYPTDMACVDVFGVIDSNVYYDPSDPIRFQKAGYGSNQSLAQWQAAPSFDVHSIVSSSGLLASPASGNYFPTAAVPAMNKTYGGRTWTRWGAIQDGTPPPVDVTSPAPIQNLAAVTTGMPAVGGNLAASVTPTVCGTYAGYTVARINDGTINANGGTATTWASDEDGLAAHWVAFDFGSAKTIDSVRIHWAFNTARTAWMTSTNVQIQSWNGSQYTTSLNLLPLTGALTTTLTNGLSTSRIRIYQPPLAGPVAYQQVLWVTEIEVFGT